MNPSNKLRVAANILTAQRLYQCPLPIIAITGSIASGKSAVASLLRAGGLDVISADLLIKEIYKKKEIFDFLQLHCPMVITNHQQINFPALRKIFFHQPSFKEQLVELLYSYLPEAFHRHLSTVTNTFVIYDVPLLYETNIQNKVDYVICVYVTPQIQLQRLISRDHIDLDIAQHMITQQISLEEKKKLTPYLIDNSGDLPSLATQTWKIINSLTSTS